MNYWLPPVLWIAAITFFSTDNFSGQNTGTLFRTLFHFLTERLTEEQFATFHFLVRKAGHFTEYAILAWLLVRAFRAGSDARWRWRWLVYSQLVIIIYALLDEYHQAFTRTRTSSIYDSLIDMTGGLTILLVIWLKRRGSGRAA